MPDASIGRAKLKGCGYQIRLATHVVASAKMIPIAVIFTVKHPTDVGWYPQRSHCLVCMVIVESPRPAPLYFVQLCSM